MFRTLLLPALTVAGLLLTVAPAHADPVAPTPARTAAAAALPVVDMAALTAAAQVEGYRGSQPGLRDDASTKLVQRALTAKGYAVPATGLFGRSTTAAYIKYQKSLGYKSIDANGMPGPTSLAKLGKGRFTVANVVQVGSRNDRYGTKRVNTRTRLMISAADATLPWTIQVSQGSYCLGKKSCAEASAGTHDGGGAIDVRVSGLTTAQRWQTVRALRAVGFAAWLRTRSQCTCWSDHIHAIAIGDTDVWQANGKYGNRDQVADYYVGRNGLSGHAKDNTPLLYRVPFTTWERVRPTQR
jgi:peptidoglycan hydrolase-like protein with peptidoglycan-binding domain